MLNPSTGKFEHMVKYVCSHTCKKQQQQRLPNFPIKSNQIIKYIKYVIIKQPQISIPLLLNILEGAVGDLFCEEKRIQNGTVAAAYKSVYKARDMVRSKYCGVIDHKDLFILPKLKSYIENLDKDTKFEYVLDANGTYKGRYTDA